MKVVSRIFRVLQADYGSSFTSRFTSDETVGDAKARWAQRLGTYSLDDIKYALNCMGKQYMNYAPTLPQFENLCDTHARDVRERMRTYTQPALPVKKASPETGKKAVSSMLEGIRQVVIRETEEDARREAARQADNKERAEQMRQAQEEVAEQYREMIMGEDDERT